MNKLKFSSILSLCLLLTACEASQVGNNSSSSENKTQSQSNTTQSQNTTELQTDLIGEEEKYLEILCDTLGADYLEGRSTCVLLILMVVNTLTVLSAQCMQLAQINLNNLSLKSGLRCLQVKMHVFMSMML